MNQKMCWVGGAVIAMLPSCSAADGSPGSDSGESSSSVELAVRPRCQTEAPAANELVCEQLATSLHYPNTVFTSATSVAAGQLTLAGQAIPAHCLLAGKMHERVGTVDGQTYAIGFEMRLPLAWNRR